MRTFGGRLAFALALITLTACENLHAPTRPSTRDATRLITCDDGCGGGGGDGGGGGGSPPPPFVYVSSLSVYSPYLEINAGSDRYTATLYNPGGTLTGVVAQGYISQGLTSRAAGGTLIDCHAGLGVLPNGTCQISFTIVAGNNYVGSGTLVPGGANFDLEIVVGSQHFSQLAYVQLVPGILGAAAPASLSMSGAPASVAVTVQNTGTYDVTGVGYEVWIMQPGARHRWAQPLASCGGISAIIPASSNCTQLLSVSSSNESWVDGGPLAPGPATLQLVLELGTGDVASRTFPITLTP